MRVPSTRVSLLLLCCLAAASVPAGSRPDDAAQLERAPAPPRAAPAAPEAPRAPQAPQAPQAPRAREFRYLPARAWTVEVSSEALRESAESLAARLEQGLDLEVFVVAYRTAGGELRYAVLLGAFDERDDGERAIDLVLPLLGEHPLSAPRLRPAGDVQALMVLP